MQKVVVLMSTFNGEKYIKTQIDSVLSQSDINVKLIVRDDGSTDKTIDILEEYKEKGLISLTKGNNIGYANSFMELLNNNIDVYNNEYFAFCDQDDFWESSKLINGLRKLQQSKKSKFQLYFSSLNIVNNDLNDIGKKNYDNLKISLPVSMVRYNISGCTMIFNKDLAFEAVKNKNYKKISYSHDQWIYTVCLAKSGNVIYDKNSYIKYRQHESNVTGIRQGFLKRLKNEISFFHKRKNINFEAAIVLYRDYRNDMDFHIIKLLEEVISYKNSFLLHFKFFFDKRFKFGKISIDFLHKLKVLFKVF